MQAERRQGGDEKIPPRLDHLLVGGIEPLKVESQAERNERFIRQRLVRDFHCHSNCSDGLFSPTELVSYVAGEGVRQLILSDHDTIEGLGDAMEATKKQGVDFLSGIEVTSKTNRGKDAHILGYGFNIENAEGDPEFMGMLNAVRDKDREWAYSMCKKSIENPLRVTTQDSRVHTISVSEGEMEKFKGTISSTFHMALVLSKKLAEVSDELNMPARYVHYVFFRRPEEDRRTESYDPEILERYKPLLEKYK